MGLLFEHGRLWRHIFGLRLSLDHIWILALLGLIWLFLCLAPLPANDLWWHMAAGRTMVEERALLTTNRWAYSLPADNPYVYQSWLSEILMYALYQLGREPLLSLSRTLVIVISYGLVAWHALRRSMNGMAVGLALFCAMMAGWGNWTLRPQTLALLPGSAFIVILGEYLAGRLSSRWLMALPALTLLWVNMHGSFVLAVALTGLSWLGTLLDTLRNDIDRPRREQVRMLTVILLSVITATLLNPLGWDIYNYVRMMLANESLQRWFIEWQPPVANLDLRNAGFWFFFLVLLIAALMAVGRRRPSGSDLLWYCGLSWLCFDGIRYVMWFALFLTPLLAERIAVLVPVRKRPSVSPMATMSIVAGLIVLVIATLPWFLPVRYLGPAAEANFATAGPYRLLLDSNTPVAASEWLAQRSFPGRFWTDMSFSSYTIWRLPEKQVFADLRVELFPTKVWEEYFAIARGDRQSLDVIDRWDISHLLLDLHNQEALARLLSNTPGWCEAFREDRMAIYARCELLMEIEK